MYDLSCAIGPCLVPASAWSPGPGAAIQLAIGRGGSVLYSDEVLLSTMRRTHEDLRAWLLRALAFPRGVVLLTGTSIVPGPEVTLLAGDEVVIAAEGLGTLRNRVRTVGHGLTDVDGSSTGPRRHAVREHGTRRSARRVPVLRRPSADQPAARRCASCSRAPQVSSSVSTVLWSSFAPWNSTASSCSFTVWASASRRSAREASLASIAV